MPRNAVCEGETEKSAQLLSLRGILKKMKPRTIGADAVYLAGHDSECAPRRNFSGRSCSAPWNTP